MSPSPAPLASDPALPLVSVVVPAFNAEATLEETLRSAAAQTYLNLEILIVDDGSTDQTRAIAEAFCRTDPRGRVLSQANGGVAAARNLGIAQAAGEWITPLDADDLWHPTKIAKQVAVALAAAEPPGFVYCWYHHIDAAGRVFASGWRRLVAGRALAQQAYLNPVENGSALLIRRDVALAVGGYDSSLRARGGEGCEDLLIQSRIAHDHAVAAVPEHLVGYRVHDRSMSSNADQMMRSWRLVSGDIAGMGAIPPQVTRWALARASLGLAQTKLGERRWREMLRPIARALRLDPIRSSAVLAYRLGLIGVRLLRGPRPDRPRPLFQDADPLDYIPRDPFEIRPLTALLEAFDARRLKRLAELDARRIAG